MKFEITLLDKSHDRSQFSSDCEPLNRYFREQVTQDIRRRVTTCYVALSSENWNVVGYYTLASSSVFLGDLPDLAKRKLPRYPTVPAVRMGRLAVDKSFKGKGLGATLLADALKRVASSEIAAYALVVDAKYEKAIHFYEHFGFIALIDEPFILFLPLTMAPMTVKLF